MNVLPCQTFWSAPGPIACLRSRELSSAGSLAADQIRGLGESAGMPCSSQSCRWKTGKNTVGDIAMWPGKRIVRTHPLRRLPMPRVCAVHIGSFLELVDPFLYCAAARLPAEHFHDLGM